MKRHFEGISIPKPFREEKICLIILNDKKRIRKIFLNEK